jgi:aldose 1-epimerase
MSSSIESYKICSPEGAEAEILNYGATLRSLRLPTHEGMQNVVLGYPALEDYWQDDASLGVSVGRFANRIAEGKFSLDGVDYQLPCNEKDINHLHGGSPGFGQRLWALVSQTENTVLLELESEDGEQGFPGNMKITAEYRMEAGMRLYLEYRATTDKATPVNLCSHAYFNLNGVPGMDDEQDYSSIENHLVEVNASHFTPVNSHCIPTGELQAVKGMPLDLRNPTRIADRINLENEQLEIGGGFDHNFVIEQNSTDGSLVYVGMAKSEDTGIQMKLYSNQEGVQFYTGNNLDGLFPKRSGLCLETQNYPDAPNHSNFPNSILRPGEQYSAVTVFEFSVG